MDWLFERTQGNALFAIGLVRALLEEDADLAAPRLQRLPEALTERVARRMRALDESSRSVLELLAVLGRPAELGDLVALTGRPLDELAPAPATPGGGSEDRSGARRHVGQRRAPVGAGAPQPRPPLPA